MNRIDQIGFAGAVGPCDQVQTRCRLDRCETVVAKIPQCEAFNMHYSDAAVGLMYVEWIKP